MLKLAQVWTMALFTLAAGTPDLAGAAADSIHDRGESAGNEVTAISQVYELEHGADVTVIGRVIVPPDRFTSSIGNAGFALNDRTRGIFVCTDSDFDLRIGRNVRVEGKLSEIQGMPCIAATRVDRVGRREVRLPTGKVPTSAIGSIISVQGTITSVVPDGDFGTKVFVDDGSGEIDVYLNKNIGLDDLHFIREGVEIRARGFVAMYPDFGEITPELDPRSSDDIQEIRRRHRHHRD